MKQQGELHRLMRPSATLATARALRWREDFQAFYDQDPSYAPEYLRRWCHGAKRSRLQPIKDFVALVEKHWDGIIAWHASHLSNGLLEGIKGNQPALRNQLKALPWKDIPVGHTSTDRDHGRVDKRTLKVVAVSAGIVFPHAVQAIQITRRTRKLTGKKWRTEVVYAITSLTTSQATTAQLAAWIRGHWCVENRLHWVRDVTFDEDRSQVRTGNGPRVMASLPRHQHPANGRRQQHRQGPPTSLMGPTQTRRATPDQLRWDFAGTLIVTPDLEFSLHSRQVHQSSGETKTTVPWRLEVHSLAVGLELNLQEERSYSIQIGDCHSRTT